MNAITKLKTSHKLKPRIGCDIGTITNSYNSGTAKDAYYATFGIWPSVCQRGILNPKAPYEIFYWAAKEKFTLDTIQSILGRASTIPSWCDTDADDIGAYVLLQSERKIMMAVTVPKGKGDMNIVMYAPVAQWDYVTKSMKYLYDLIGSDVPTGNIHLLAAEQGEFTLMPLSIDKPVMDLALNYGHQFLQVDQRIKAFVKKKTSGLILFHGVTGSGKSTYIYHLIHSTDQKVVYIPNNVISQMTNPGFVPFLINEARGTVIVVEDAEAVLLKRNQLGDSGVSTLLNITDGILGRLLKCKVICTFNIARTELDEALLRKGRLGIEHEFNKLGVIEANRLLTHLGSGRKTDIPLTVAEIYNEDGGRNITDSKEIGFAK